VTQPGLLQRGRVWLIGLMLVVAASACRVDTTVEISFSEDGSGSVEVMLVADAAAVSLLADDPAELDFSDLSEAGWDVTGPLVENGGMRIEAAKQFLNASELQPVLDEIVGPGVVFSDAALTQTREFARIDFRPASTDYAFSARVDPTPPLAALGDELLAAQLDGEPLGRSLAEIESAAGVSFAEALGLTVVVTMPRGAASDTGEAVDETVTWTFAYGDPVAEIDARASIDDILPRVWALVALLAFALFALVVLAQLISFVLAKMRVRKGWRRRDIRKRQRRASSREVEASRPRRRMLRLLVIDVHGVIVRPTDPFEELLLPLISAERPEVDPATVRSHHRQLVLGRLSPEEFWSEMGLGPMAEQIETRYLSSFRLVPGLHPFLDRMATSRLPVAVVGNQPRVWGDRLRRMASLDGVVALWTVSGDVGSTLPEPALFEATRRTMSVDLFDCFYLSNVPEHLDTAAELGMATGLFITASEQPPDDCPHTVVRGFEDLLRSGGG